MSGLTYWYSKIFLDISPNITSLSEDNSCDSPIRSFSVIVYTEKIRQWLCPLYYK